MLTVLASLLTPASSLAGFRAARLWWRASRLPIPERIPPFVPGRSTGDPHLEILLEAFATAKAVRELSEALRDGARLSARAALWTGLSVIGLLAASTLSWTAAGLGAT